MLSRWTHSKSARSGRKAGDSVLKMSSNVSTSADGILNSRSDSGSSPQMLPTRAGRTRSPRTCILAVVCLAELSSPPGAAATGPAVHVPSEAVPCRAPFIALQWASFAGRKHRHGLIIVLELHSYSSVSLTRA